MINKRIAVILLGEQNSGKTTTIKYFDEKYDRKGRKKKQCRRGWRDFILFKEEIWSLILQIYLVPASPTERFTPLKNWLRKSPPPQFLLLAEQVKGKQYQKTIDFLEENDYSIVIFELSNSKTDAIWGRWNNKNKDEVLEKRAVLIGKEFKRIIIQKIGRDEI